jgi:hypothetical protein
MLTAKPTPKPSASECRPPIRGFETLFFLVKNLINQKKINPAITPEKAITATRMGRDEMDRVASSTATEYAATTTNGTTRDAIRKEVFFMNPP